MKIYARSLTLDDLYTAAGSQHTVEARSFTPRKPGRAWTVHLFGGGPRFINTGKTGAGGDKAPTWDQVGEWLARLYEIDSGMEVVAALRYRNREDFHKQTGGKYL